jgi:hypothetical protein
VGKAKAPKVKVKDTNYSIKVFYSIDPCSCSRGQPPIDLLLVSQLKINVSLPLSLSSLLLTNQKLKFFPIFQLAQQKSLNNKTSRTV